MRTCRAYRTNHVSYAWSPFKLNGPVWYRAESKYTFPRLIARAIESTHLGYHREVPLEFPPEVSFRRKTHLHPSVLAVIPPEAGKIWRNAGFCGLKSLPRENHADLKYPLSGKRCAARASIVWPWGAILDFARWLAGTNGPSSGGLARFDSS